jgi:FHA domain
MGGVPATPPVDASSGSDSKALAEAERAGRPFLQYRDGHGAQQLFFFAPGAAAASVGRQPQSDLLLGWDTQVSRLHARFERVEDDWVLFDDGLSRNGTFLNGERLDGGRRLKDGDSIRFGTTDVTFRSPPPGQPRPAPSLGPSAAGLSSTQRRVLVALCRPFGSGGAVPASDEQIAEELFLSPAAVATHVGVLCAKLGVEEKPAHEARLRLAERAFATGLISQGEA